MPTRQSREGVPTMPELVKLTLIAMVILLLKHTVADFFLQTGFQHRNKGRYGHPGGILHAVIHVLLSLPVFLLLPVDLDLMATILLAEFLVHYHIDWTKERVTKGFGWTPTQAAFWHALGVDQLLHGLTYVIMVAVLMSHAPIAL